MSKFLFLIILLLVSCLEMGERKPLHFFPILSGNEEISIQYPQNEYILNLGEATEIKPILKGTVSSCFISEALPMGLTLSAQCIIYGAPQEVVNQKMYTITARHLLQSKEAVIQLTVTQPISISYPNSPYTLGIGGNSTISPNVIGTIQSCEISPSLPDGLILQNNCSIVGIPTTLSSLTTYTVIASNPTNSATAQLQLEVRNLPSVSFSSPDGIGLESVGTVNIPVDLSFTENAIINYTVSGTATHGSDYSLSGSLTFINGGPTTQNLTLNVIDDTLYENDETVVITLSIVSGAIPGTHTVYTYTIENNDPILQVSFNANTSSIAENGILANVQINLSAASGLDVTVPININVISTATNGGDYTTSSSVTIPAGSTSANLTVNITDDSIDENDEAVVLELGTPTNATLGAITTHTLIILDNDPPPTVEFVSASSSGLESVTSADFMVVLSQVSEKTVTVNYATSSGSAIAGSDYTATSGTLTFPPGVSSQTISVNINNDGIYESGEDFYITLSSPVNAGLGIASHTYTILNEDTPPNVQFSVASQSVNENGGTVTVTISQSAVSGFNTTVNFSIHASSTATGGGTDYSFTPSSPVSIMAGSTSTNITFTMNDDTLYENDETIVIELTSVSNAGLGTTTTHTITILNDDPKPQISFTMGGAGSVGEGSGNYVLLFTLSAVSGLPATVTVNTTDGTATAGLDYTEQVSQVVTIPAGSTTGSLNIPILEDLFSEGNENFTITISSPVNANIAGPTIQTVTITDNEIPIQSARTLDCNGNGKIDHYLLSFDSAVTDSSFPGYVLNGEGTATSHWLVAGYSNVRLKHGSSLSCPGYSDTPNDATIYIQFDEGTSFDTGAKPDLTTSSTPGLLGPAGTVGIVFTASVTEIENARPVVVSITPASGTTAVPINSEVIVSFSEDMNTSTFNTTNFTLTGAGAVSGTVSTVNSKTVKFTPSAILAYDQLHTVSLASMTDVNGNAMPGFTSTFTTALKYKITGTVSGATSNIVLGISVNGGAVTNLSGTTTTYDTGNVLVNGQAYELSIVTQPTGQVCALLSTPTNPAGDTFTGITDLTIDVNCVNGYFSGSGVVTQPTASNGIHLYQGNAATVAGANSITPGFANGSGTSARFDVPFGITSDGNFLYVTEEKNHTVRKIDSSGNVTTLAGNGSAGNTEGSGAIASLCHPRGITTDGTYLYVSEFGSGMGGRRIKRIRISTGYVETIAGDNNTLHPTAASVDGIGLAARFNQPAGLALENGFLYIADRGVNKILKMNLSTRQVTTLASGGSLSQPEGLVLVGNFLYTANVGNHTILKIDKTDGAQTLLAGGIGLAGHIDAIAAQARFNSPHSLATDGTNLFVVEQGNWVVRQINVATQRVTTLAGNTTNGLINGIGVSASFSPLNYAYFDGKALYISHNHAIRKITNSSLLAYYPLSGNTFDYAGSSNLSVLGSPTLTTGTYNEANGAYSIGTGNGFKTSAIAINANLTMAGWVKINSYASEQILFYNGNSGANGYGFHINPSGEFRLLLGGVSAFPITPKPATGMWTHLAVVGPSSLPGKWKVYLNGKEILSVVDSPNLPASFFSIGMSASDNQHLDGSVAKVRFYNRILNEAEIHELAQEAMSSQVGPSFSTGAIGLLSHYNFENGSPTDSGALNRTLTNSGTSTTLGKEGDTNGARTFNGSSFLSASTPVGLPLGNAPRTLCAWIHPSQSDARTVISYGVGAAGQAMGISLQSGKYHFWNYGSGITSTADARLNTWQHFCGVYNGSSGWIYVDGVLLSAGGMGTVNTAFGNFHIGQNVDINVRFAGKIDDVRIYNDALTQTQIRQLASQIPTGLVARYDFTNDINDMSGFGINLTQTGTTSAAPDRFGLANNSRLFNGVHGNYLQGSDTNLPMGANPRTICIWYRSESGINAVPFHYGGAGNRTGLWLSNPNLVRYWTDSTNLDVNVPIPHYVWRHACISYTGTQYRSYLNGRMLGSGSITLNTTSSGSFFLASYLSGNEYGGQLDEIVIYNRQLEYGEIRALSGYHAMQTTAWDPNPTSSSLGVHYQADTFSNLADNTPTTTQWIDGGKGFNGTNLNNPVFRTGANGINGRPAIQFNGTNRYFDAGGTTLSFSGLSLFTVAKLTAAYDVYRALVSKDGGGCSGNRFNLHRYDFGFFFEVDTNVNISSAVGESSIVTAINSSSTIQISKNGGTPNASSSGNYSGTTSSCPLQIGARTSGSNYFNGLISEVLLFTNGISSSDREIVECYLSSKYGIPISHDCP